MKIKYKFEYIILLLKYLCHLILILINTPYLSFSSRVIVIVNPPPMFRPEANKATAVNKAALFYNTKQKNLQ